MTQGIVTFTADGRPMLTPDGAGGVFVEALVSTVGSSIRTYSGLEGMVLRVFQVGAGAHTWSVTTAAGGAPQLTLTPIPNNPNGGTTLLVFAA